MIVRTVRQSVLFASILALLATVALAADPSPGTGLGVRQRHLVGARLQSLETRIQMLARSVERTDPQRAALLIALVNEMRQMKLHDRIEATVTMLNTLDLEVATENQRKIIEDLEALISIIDEFVTDEPKSDEMLRKKRLKRLVKWREQVVKLLDDEAEQFRESDKIANRDRTLRRLDRNIAKLRELVRRQHQLIDENAQVRSSDLDQLPNVADKQSDLKADTRALARRIEGQQPFGGKPADDQKPGDQKPGDQKPGDQKPGDQKPGDQKPGEEKPGDDQLPAADQPGSSPLTQAAAHQGKAAEKLNVGRGKAAEIDQQAALKKLKEALAQLQRERGRVAGAPPEAADGLADRQEGTAAEARQLGDEIAAAEPKNAAGQKPGGGQKPDGDRKQNPIQQAGKKMDNAAGKLSDRDAKQAGQDQRQAIDDLKDGLADIDKQLDELQKEIQAEKLAALIELYQQMLPRQQDVTLATALVDKNRRDAGRLRRADAIMLRKLAAEEAALADIAEVALEKILADDSSVILNQVAKRLYEDLTGVAARLEARHSGQDTNILQREIEGTIEELIEALSESQNQNNQEPQGAKPPGGQPPGAAPPDQPKPLLPENAELKLLRAAQQRVRRLTAAIQEGRENEVLDDLRRRELKSILDRQAEITRLARELAEQE